MVELPAVVFIFSGDSPFSKRHFFRILVTHTDWSSGSRCQGITTWSSKRYFKSSKGQKTRELSAWLSLGITAPPDMDWQAWKHLRLDRSGKQLADAKPQPQTFPPCGYQPIESYWLIRAIQTYVDKKNRALSSGHFSINSATSGFPCRSS